MFAKENERPEDERSRSLSTASEGDAAFRFLLQTLRARRKSRPDVAKKLARSPCYGLRFLANRIDFFVSAEFALFMISDP